MEMREIKELEKGVRRTKQMQTVKRKKDEDGD
jgi:hypothetical protein